MRNQLKSLRLSLGLSPQEMAIRLGTNYDTYVLWEQRYMGVSTASARIAMDVMRAIDDAGLKIARPTRHPRANVWEIGQCENGYFARRSGSYHTNHVFDTVSEAAKYVIYEMEGDDDE